MRLPLIVLIFLLYSCDIDSTQEMREWYSSFKTKAYTVKEKEYVSKLKSKGFFNVKINSPYIGIDARGLSVYELSIYSPNCCYKDRMNDSLYDLSKTIAKELYSEVIEDSILYDIGQIRIHTYIRSKESDTLYFDFRKNFRKKDLETETGFKVISDRSNLYRRVKV